MRAQALDALAAVMILGITAFHLAGAHVVPFHPDETSLLYQSRNFERLWSDPGSLAWSATRTGELEQEYRLLNAPLPTYVLATGRLLAGFSAESVSVDWDWSRSWEANIDRGAYPPVGALRGARLASTALILPTLLFLYLTGRKLGGRAAGLAAVAVLGFHPLALVHTRRAMAEGTMLLAVTFALWGIPQADRRPWLGGLACGLAIGAKQSALPLALVGVGATLWPLAAERASYSWRSAALRLLQFGFALIAIVFLLNPVLWADPVQAGAEMMRVRRDLVSDQFSATAWGGGAVLDSPTARVASLVGHLFILPPQFAEVGNYIADTREAVAAYEANPLHLLLRGWIAGAGALVLALLGFGAALRKAVTESPERRRLITLLAAATAVQALALLAAIPLPYQRYYMPLLPLTVLWVVYGAGFLLHALPAKRSPNRQTE